MLSGIKPGRATNRNEGLHEILNKIIGSSQYGVELSYALYLHQNFYQNNERIQAKVESDANFLQNNMLATYVLNRFPIQEKALDIVIRIQDGLPSMMHSYVRQEVGA